MNNNYDVVILGGGLAGVTLARHLLLETDKTVLLVEKRSKLPQDHQKVGESSVQLAGYYFSKVLDLEDYLFHEHFMKYNLRFYWKSAARDNQGFEDYGQGYIRKFSNLASYQLNRNTFEAEVLRRNQESERFALALGTSKLDVDLIEDESGNPHVVRFDHDGERREIEARWVVDTSGRSKVLARKKELRRPNTIRHGAFYWWVDGLVDIEKLTDLSRGEMRKHPSRRETGHLPFWLATNHFCDEGLWFWVIPLQHKTSLGLVFDKEVIDHRDVFTVEKATQWVCDRFPMFARDLPGRKVLDFGGHKDFSFDCAQTISAHRWALAGEAGRFTDPLYSPGSDLIAVYNTLIVDAIQIDDPIELANNCKLYESTMKAVYQAYVPTYATSYDALGDQETFTIKYAWELAVYFGVYVFPFINDLFTEKRFLVSFLRTFSKLGPLNRGVQQMLSDFFQWKRKTFSPQAEPVYFDFTKMTTLDKAEKAFYEVGLEVDEARKVLLQQYENLEEMALFIAVHLAAVALGDERALTHRAFIESFDVQELSFDPEEIAARWAKLKNESGEPWQWNLDPHALQAFNADRSLLNSEAAA